MGGKENKLENKQNNGYINKNNTLEKQEGWIEGSRHRSLNEREYIWAYNKERETKKISSGKGDRIRDRIRVGASESYRHQCL